MAERMVASIAADLRATGLPYSLAVEAADKLNELVALLAAAETDRDRLASVIERVRTLHRGPRTERHGSGCIQCGIVWPCPTMRAIDDETGRTPVAAPTFFERRAARDPSVDHASHSMQWTGPCPECPSPRQENSDG